MISLDKGEREPNTNGKSHGPGKNLLLTLSILGITFFAELIGGTISGSLALVSDSFHVLSDILSLGLTYIALNIAINKAPSKRFPFGFHRLEVFVTIFNGLSLVFIAGFIIREAFYRFSHPSEINVPLALLVAVVGLIVNIVSMLLLSHNHEHKKDMNIRSAFWHIMGDALASAGVIVGLTAVHFFNMPVIDPLIAVIISLLLIKGGVGVTWEALRLLLQECPIDTSRAKSQILTLSHVLNVDGIYFWDLCSHVRIGTMHVITDIENIENTQTVYEEIKDLLKEKFQISNITVQFETAKMAANHSHALQHEH